MVLNDENTKVSFYPINYLSMSERILKKPHSYKFVVIIAREKGGFLFCRHRERATWELPGGHIEKDEKPLDAAKRELFEETGATDFTIRPIFDYRVSRDGDSSDGIVYLADVTNRGDLPLSEMAEVKCLLKMPDDMTYPQIQPLILKHYKELFEGDKPEFIYHASGKRLDRLVPIKATGYEEENGCETGVYGYETVKQCIPFALSFSGKRDSYIDDVTSEIYLKRAGLNEEGKGYICKLSSKTFERLDEIQFISKETVIPLEIIEIVTSEHLDIVKYID